MRTQSSTTMAAMATAPMAPARGAQHRPGGLREYAGSRVHRHRGHRLLPPLRAASCPAGAREPALAAALAAALGDAALIDYVTDGASLHAVVVRGERPAGPVRCELGPLDPLAHALGPLLFACRRLLTGHGSAASLAAARTLARHAAQALEEALLTPLAPLVAGRPLVVVPPASLRALPWPMLPGCAGRPVTIAPCAASWLAARPQSLRPPGSQAAGAPRVVLVAGPGLLQGEDEIRALAALYPGAEVLAGPQATVAGVLAALDGAGIAHVAAHGRYRADNPASCCLTLADGPLTIAGLQQVKRPPQTIMITACELARACARPGGEAAGLAPALLALGTRCVLAPLLPLPEHPAARLALSWHRHLVAGLPPAQALAAATGAASPADRLATAAMVCLGNGS